MTIHVKHAMLLLASGLLLAGCGGSSSSSGRSAVGDPLPTITVQVAGLQDQESLQVALDLDSTTPLEFSQDGEKTFPAGVEEDQQFTLTLDQAPPRCQFADNDDTSLTSQDASSPFVVNCGTASNEEEAGAQTEQDGLKITLAPLLDENDEPVGLVGNPIERDDTITGTVTFSEESAPYNNKTVTLIAAKGKLSIDGCNSDQVISPDDGSTLTDANGEVCFELTTNNGSGVDVLTVAAGDIELTHDILFTHGELTITLDLLGPNGNPGYGEQDNPITQQQNATVKTRVTLGGQPVVNKKLIYEVLDNIAVLSPPVPVDPDNPADPGPTSNDLTDADGVSNGVELECLNSGPSTVTAMYAGEEKSLDFQCE